MWQKGLTFSEYSQKKKNEPVKSKEEMKKEKELINEMHKKMAQNNKAVRVGFSQEKKPTDSWYMEEGFGSNSKKAQEINDKNAIESKHKMLKQLIQALNISEMRLKKENRFPSTGKMKKPLTLAEE